ncbi:MAG TPA: MarC family protein [Spirochaetales bacterium]|nr:MarC family protein [Spirochaetales bacterium]HOV37178.1 MarC family protein [Spirochaetales bacterium]
MGQNVFALFITFFLVVDPLGILPLYLSLTAGYSKSQKKRVIYRALLTAGTVFLIFILFGRSILHFLGIQTGSFFIAGGILLFFVSMDMLFAAPKRTKTSEQEKDSEDISIFPLGIPILAGPGTITTILLYVSKESATIYTRASIGIVLLLILLLAGILLGISNYLVKIISHTGLSVIERIMGLILSGLSVQFVFDGLVKLGILH